MTFPMTFLPVLIIFGSVFSCWMLTANESLRPPTLNIQIPMNLPDSAKFPQLER